MRRRFLILMNILLIIMASLFVQCKPENGNGDSTDEEAAFPGLEESPLLENEEAPAVEGKEAPAVEEKEAPAVEEEEAPAVEEKACQLIEMLFRNVRDAIWNLQKGKKLFSPGNDLSFYLIIRDGVANALQKQERIFLKPELTVSTDEGGYRLFTFTLEGKFPQPKVTVACRGNTCNDIFKKLKRLQRNVNCIKTRGYFFLLFKNGYLDTLIDLTVKFGIATGQQPWRLTALSSTATMETLIEAGTADAETWHGEKPSYDKKSTITLQVAGSTETVQLKLFCSGSIFKCNPPTPQRAFYQGLVDLLNVHYGRIRFTKKPRRRFKRARNLPPQLIQP